MFFNNRNRVEEDLERIRKANLSPEQQEIEAEKERAFQAKMQAEDLKLTAKDILAMSIAVFSLLIPYVLAILAAMALVLFVILR